ncbi:hydrogenase nickel incorporation protein HypB [Caldanaerobius polysaccharolyticus]|uniref:hydrogenase nickel incorporation protein HypB n=1 Tax=Caldanaerobius polysaccharolyticus TaxID=44256 RepID=UPI00047ADB0F|nr:hydrogenase nickel incorporation protein HypB [Caldanaerobius polysaccharolyticus]
MEIKVLKNILDANDRIAGEIRALFKEKGITAVNIIGSPGCGKTSLILKTIERLKGKLNIQVIEGDIQSSIDAEKISAAGSTAVQINTGGACHLDANMIKMSLNEMDLKKGILFIENVGNLVCPAEFEIGEDHKVAVISVPEGHDKPYKYPLIFSKASAVVLTKADLLPYVDFDMEFFKEGLKALNPDYNLFVLSAKTEEGLDQWIDWLEHIGEGKGEA